MLFNSYIFIVLFLPLTLLLFFRLARPGDLRIAIAFLVAASLFYYAWWNPVYIGLIIGSILFNYALGATLGENPRRAILAFGVCANLALLGYYKYSNFFLQNINSVFSADFRVDPIVLPLAISFFTFQQIAYLVDAYRNEAHEYNFLHYCLFVTFFPQLIAGPIVHHNEMMPQFMKKETFIFRHQDFAIGLALFTLGLFKKVVLADNLAPYATEVFSAASYMPMTLLEAWRGALAYTFQLYFDFSGYSDMAIGIGFMFGIRLPFNFNSPYKSLSIIDFWRRWHMTLSRFLKHYVYIPLGGNRRGKFRRYLNLMITMLLGGLWHGAGWTFVIWGGLHGIYLVINNAWVAIRMRFLPGFPVNHSIWKWCARAVTFGAVVVGWVFFRAENYQQAVGLLQGMAGLNGFALPLSDAARLGSMATWLQDAGVQFIDLPYSNGIQDLAFIALILASLWLLPNSQELMGLVSHKQVNFPATKPSWKAGRGKAVVFSILGLITFLQLSRVSEFLYFQF
jgi:alginate O-acetyltransferase complex protein AlgI